MVKKWLTTVFLIFISFDIFSQSARIHDLEKILQQVKDTARVNILLELATEYEYVDHQKAREYAQQARDLAVKVNFIRGIIRSQYELAIISFLKGDRPGALSFLEAGMDFAGELRDELLLASGYFHLSHYYEEEGDYPKALDFLHQALSIYEAGNRKLKISQCYSSFGGIYKSLGQYEHSLNYFFESLRIKESVDDLRGISIIHSNIGGVYLLTSRLKDARDYFLKALAIDRVNDDQEGIVYNLSQLGVVNQKSGDYSAAISFFDSALVMARDLNFRIDESVLLGNIGSTLRSQKRLNESLTYLLNSLSLKMELKRFGSAAHSCNSICETYLEMGELIEAKKYALQAIELARDADANQHRVGLYLLAKCEYALNDFKNAYDHLVQANVITDSIFTIESEARMHEMEVKYQSEQKEKEILTLTREKETAEFRRNTFIFAGVSVSLLLFLLYNQQRIRSRKNRLLLDKEKELDVMKSRFFANISHEFRTPLTLILGPLDDLIMRIEQADIKRQLKVMARNGQRLLDLINQLLDLSKIESGNLTMNISTSDIISLIEGVSMSFHSIAEQKNIDLELDILPKRLELNFDRAKMETILINLLSNAFKFTPDLGKISVQTRIQGKKGKYGFHDVIRIVVSDSGSGIPEVELDFIFNRFYQSDHNQLSQQEGSGIGLALTKELVELHGGHISAQNNPGGGTQIIVEIPLDLKVSKEEVSGEPVIIQKKVLSIPEEPEVVTKRVKKQEEQLPLILLIEDHAEVRGYVQEILGNRYRVHVVEDGEKGISGAYDMIPDLILCDVMMPKKDGFEVCHELKNDERTSHIPIILLTAKSDTEEKLEGLQTKADDYVTKPFVPRELLVRVQNLIESREKLRERFQRELILKPSEVAVNSVEEQFVNKLLKIVEEYIGDEKFGVEKLALEIGMSRSQIHRKLLALTNQAPNQFIRTFRLTRAMELVKKRSANTSEIAYQVGFSSPSYFTKCFRDHYGRTPTEILESSPEASGK